MNPSLHLDAVYGKMGKTDEETGSLLDQKSSQDSKPKFPLELFPLEARPYIELMRLEKPNGTVLIFWPCAYGLTMAAFSRRLPFIEYMTELIKALVGAILLRSSACTVNDIFDRDMDAGVGLLIYRGLLSYHLISRCKARTKNRPLASGRISVSNAIAFLLVQYIIGIIFFFFALPRSAFWIAMFQLFPLFAIYPLLKRVTYWPQAWLGFAMNFGFITSWISVAGFTSAPLLSIAMTGYWCWTMVYDTIYACQDIQDDIKMGVLSTAILFGSWIRPLLQICASIFVVMLAVVGYLNQQTAVYFTVSVGGTAMYLVWQFRTVDLESSSSCWRNFVRNGHLGLVIYVGLVLDYAFCLGHSESRVLST